MYTCLIYFWFKRQKNRPFNDKVVVILGCCSFCRGEVFLFSFFAGERCSCCFGSGCSCFLTAVLPGWKCFCFLFSFYFKSVVTNLRFHYFSLKFAFLWTEISLMSKNIWFSGERYGCFRNCRHSLSFCFLGPCTLPSDHCSCRQCWMYTHINNHQMNLPKTLCLYRQHVTKLWD